MRMPEVSGASSCSEASENLKSYFFSESVKYNGILLHLSSQAESVSSIAIGAVLATK